MRRNAVHLGVGACLLAAPLGARGEGERAGYSELVRRHIAALAANCTDAFGPAPTRMWMASVDTRTGRPLLGHTPRRVYRLIGAPDGVACYWDQPLLVAAFALDGTPGGKECAQAAEAYLRDFLARCVDKRGVFLWGNHVYYNALKDAPAPFQGGHHELRPITPAWELFWRIDPRATERYIRTVARRHIYDPKTGGFNRHDDGAKGCAFLESGGILVESLAWLHAKTGDAALLRDALLIAHYSYGHRGQATGLLANNPDQARWDAEVCTTEVGVWANSLLRAARYTGDRELRDMAASAVGAYIRLGYDPEARRYYGQLRIADGAPVAPAKTGYWPRKHADIWNADQWPHHDYPMALADACATLFTETGEPGFRQAVERWADIAARSPAPLGPCACAENYGRCIHFLAHAARVLKDERFLAQASALAQEAVERLLENGLFQGHPGSHIYTSVDGVGFLLLALLELERGQPPDLLGFGF